MFELMNHCNSDFVTHAMKSSNPFEVCTNNLTFVPYRLAMKFHNQLLTTFDLHNSSALCSDEFLNKNRMNVVTSFISTSKSLWEAANCDKCYNDTTSLDQNFSRNTKEFMDLQFSYNSCVLNTTSLINNSAVCTDCSNEYQTLNALYERLKKTSGNKICFDLEDKVSQRLSFASFKILSLMIADEQNTSRLVSCVQMLPRQARLFNSFLQFGVSGLHHLHQFLLRSLLYWNQIPADRNFRCD